MTFPRELLFSCSLPPSNVYYRRLLDEGLGNSADAKAARDQKPVRSKFWDCDTRHFDKRDCHKVSEVSGCRTIQNPSYAESLEVLG